MTRDRALALAAACWCTQTTEMIPFYPEVAAIFAETLMQEVNRFNLVPVDIDARISALEVEIATLKATRKLRKLEVA